MKDRAANRRASAALLVVTFVSAALTAACTETGPSDLTELCSAHKSFRSEYDRPHVLSNKGVFRSLKKLGDVAARYTDDSEISAAGPRLKKMGESDSFDMFEAERLTSPIAGACRNEGS